MPRSAPRRWKLRRCRNGGKTPTAGCLASRRRGLKESAARAQFRFPFLVTGLLACQLSFPSRQTDLGRCLIARPTLLADQPEKTPWRSGDFFLQFLEKV